MWWNRAVSRELPGNYPYNIKTELIKRYLQPWERPSIALVQEVEARLRKELKKVVEGELTEHVHGGLQLTVWYDACWYESPFFVLTIPRNVVEECIRLLSEATRARIQEAYKMEQYPTTRRDRHFLYYKTNYLEHYRVHYQSSLQGEGFFTQLANKTLPDMDRELVSTILSNLLDAGVVDLKGTDLLKLAPYSENEAALEIMAEVRAYYHSMSVSYISAHPSDVRLCLQLRCSAISRRSPCLSITCSCLH